MNTLRGALAVVLLRLLSCLPLPALQVLGAWQGYCWYRLRTEARRTVENNLRYCFPEMADGERDRLTRAALVETARATLEMAILWCGSPWRTGKLIGEVHGQALMDEALARKRGVIVLAPHLGNWEAAGIYLARQARITCMYSPAKLAALDRLIREGRQRNGTELAPADAGGVRQLLKALKAGEMVGILPDQVPDESGGVFAPFFGRPAFSMTLLSALARRTGAAVICCFARRRDDGRGFDIELLPADPAVADADTYTAVCAMNASVERCVEHCREQYQWSYKRFRERDGGLSLYLRDRRLQPRRILQEVVSVRDPAAQGAGARLVNLTPGGLMLEGSAASVVGTQRPLHCERHSQQDNEILELEARCEWSRELSPGRWGSGWRLVFVSPSHNRRLLQWLEQLEQRPLATALKLNGLQLLALIPLSWWRMAGRLQARMVARFANQHRNIARNLDAGFSFSCAAERESAIRESLCQHNEWRLGRIFLRLAGPGRLDRALPLQGTAAVQDQLQSVRTPGRGVLLLLPNSGPWELALREIARQHPLTLLYQPPLKDLRDRTLYRAARRDGYGVMSMHPGYGQSVLRLLREGAVVALLPDQVLITDKTVSAPLLGHELPGLDLSFLAQAPSGTAVLSGLVCPSSNPAGWQLSLQRVAGLETATGAEVYAAALQRAVEQVIQQCPWQYDWSVRVFPKK